MKLPFILIREFGKISLDFSIELILIYILNLVIFKFPILIV